jgi:WD40 repeat protein
VRFWDAASGKALHRCHHHTKPVYRLQWRVTTTATGTATAAAMNSIASSSADRTCVVFSAEAGGAVLATLKHPAPVFGCEWCPLPAVEDGDNGRANGFGYGNGNGSSGNVCTADWLATGCQDGLVRVYDVGSKNPEPVHVLKVRALRIECASAHCCVQ